MADSPLTVGLVVHDDRRVGARANDALRTARELRDARAAARLEALSTVAEFRAHREQLRAEIAENRATRGVPPHKSGSTEARISSG
jgi:hypothetical protein